LERLKKYKKILQKKKNLSMVVILGIVIIGGFGIGAIKILGTSAKYEISLEKPLHESSSVPIGAALSVNALKNDFLYRNLSITHFNSLTPENVMKMGPLRPSINKFYWNDSDYLLDFAEENDMVVHGHTLVWHQQVPGWLETYNGTKDQWRNLLKTHIQTTVGRYKGRIASWDVVNEAFQPGKYRETIWWEKIGPEYIKDAFVWAHEADPDAILYYNDFNLLGNPTKLDFTLQMIESLIDDEVPVHGIGCQAHIGVNYPSTVQIHAAIQKIDDLNLKLRISEFDICMNPGRLYWEYSNRLATLQSKRYSKVTEQFLLAGNLTGITLWGITDTSSWLHNENNLQWPLLFDEAYNPKPAAMAFSTALESHVE
jgi:endo-1,4-beta-xylanase